MFFINRNRSAEVTVKFSINKLGDSFPSDGENVFMV